MRIAVRVAALSGSMVIVGLAGCSGGVGGGYGNSGIYTSANANEAAMIQLIETLWLQFGPYMRVVYGRFGTSRLEDQHERAIAAIRDRNGPALRRAVLADLRDGMSLIAKNGFEKGA